MTDDSLHPLQPLRIPPHWHVTYNIFFEVDPSPDSMDWFNESMMLGIASDDGRYFVDMTFFPEDSPDGQFRVTFYDQSDRDNPKPIGGSDHTNRMDAVAEIEEFMHGIWRTGEPVSG